MAPRKIWLRRFTIRGANVGVRVWMLQHDQPFGLVKVAALFRLLPCSISVKVADGRSFLIRSRSMLWTHSVWR